MRYNMRNPMLTLLHSEQPKFQSFGRHSECNKVKEQENVVRSDAGGHNIKEITVFTSL